MQLTKFFIVLFSCLALFVAAAHGKGHRGEPKLSMHHRNPSVKGHSAPVQQYLKKYGHRNSPGREVFETLRNRRKHI